MSSKLPAENEMAEVVRQALRYFRTRDESDALEQNLPGVTSCHYLSDDWENTALQIIDAFKSIIPEAQHNDRIDLADLRARLDEFESSSDSWWQPAHSMFAHLDELIDERAALQSFFDQHEMLIEDEAFDLLLPVSALVDNGEPSTKQVTLFSETWFFSQQ